MLHTFPSVMNICRRKESHRQFITASIRKNWKRRKNSVFRSMNFFGKEKFTPKKWEAQIKELTQEYEKQSRRYGRSTVNLAYVELLRHNRKMDERDQKNKDQSQSRQHEKMDRGQEQKKKRQEMGL